MAPSHPPCRPKRLAALLTAILSMPIVAGGRADACEQHLLCASCTDAGVTRTDVTATAQSRRSLRRPADGPIMDNGAVGSKCYWCPFTSTCGTNGTIHHASECPTPVSDGSSPYPNLLPNWMGTLLNYTSSNCTDGGGGGGGGLASLTLLDLSLPGTHDTLSYDLSLTVSSDGLDAYAELDRFLHFFSGGTVTMLPGELEEFLRQQARTQSLDVVEQLNGGIRFLDIRIMMEEEGDVWYGVHFMQTVHPALAYLRQVREWLDEHPQEIVVVWLSKHGVTGATGQDQYPDVPESAKLKFWDEYCRLFDGLMFDSRLSTLNETTVEQLLRRNHRLVTFASDYRQFTNSSHLALDSASIDNWVYGVGAFDETRTLNAQREYFQKGPARNRAAKSNGRFNLMAMNTEGTGFQIVGAAEDRFLPHSFVQSQLVRWIFSLLSSLGAFLGLLEEVGGLLGGIYLAGVLDSCPSRIRIPGVKRWCPPTLLDVAQLSSYYDQIAIEEAFLASFASPNAEEDGLGGVGEEPTTAFPHAFYLDALDLNGTVRTGRDIGSSPPRSDDTHGTARYAYVDTVISYNVEQACGGRNGDGRRQRSIGEDCYDLKRWVAERRAVYPLQLWDDPEHGRHSDWPPTPN